MPDHDELDADVQLEQPEGSDPDGPPDASAPAVFILETALSAVNQHAAAEPEHEIGGVLVGTVIDGDRPVVLVEAAIRGHAMAHARGSVTFTHETWNEINVIKDNQYPDLKIVGWYHSHPGFGLFLSGHDLFIHRNFFTAPWQVAVVADPVAKSWGCFTWHGQELVQDAAVHTVVVQWSEGEPAAPAPQPRAADPTPIIISAPAPQERDRGVTWALGLLGLLVALLIGLCLATYNDARALRGELATLNQQVSGMSHELTVVRDRLLGVPGADASSEAPAVAPAPDAFPAPVAPPVAPEAAPQPSPPPPSGASPP